MKILLQKYSSLHFLLFIVLQCFLASRDAPAQTDFNLAQFYNTPLLTNPAWVAAPRNIQIIYNFRNQPNATDDNFITHALTGIYPFFYKNTNQVSAGLGAGFISDRAGLFLRTTGGLLSFSKNINLGENRLGYNQLALGIQGGYFQRRISLEGLTTGSNVINGIFVPGSSLNESNENVSQSHFVVTPGLMWHASDSLGRLKAFAGIAAFNINQPDVSFFNDLNDRLPYHLTLSGGYTFFENFTFSIQPNFRYIIRTGNNEVNAGSWINFNMFRNREYGVLKQGLLGVGLWYNFNKAFVGSIQLDQPHYFLALSFDLPTAKSSPAWQGRNVFEISAGIRINKRKRIPRELYALDTLKHDDVNYQVDNSHNPVQMNPVKVEPPPKPKNKTKPGGEDGAFRFKFNSDELDDASKALLDSVVLVLMEYPETVLDISGHTCDIGAEEKNLDLSKRRAESVRKYLLKYDDLDPKRITTSGYGESRPLVPNTSEENRKKNRRVAFKVKFPE